MEFMAESAEQPKPKEKTRSSLTDIFKTFIDKVWRFIKSPVFLKNSGLIIVLLLVSFWILSFALNVYTKHNQAIQVDNYVGMDVEDATRKIRKKDFLVEVKETYGKPAKKITTQYPAPRSRVKEGRTIYLTVKNGKMEEVELPDFSNSDNYDNYSRRLANLGLVHIVEKQFNARLSENTILYIFYKGKKLSGYELRKGQKAFKGDTVKCVVTTRYSPTVPLPDLVCLDYEAASFLLEAHELVVGKIYGNVSDRNNAYVWKQVPAFQVRQQINKGRPIDIYLTDSYPDGCN